MVNASGECNVNYELADDYCIERESESIIQLYSSDLVSRHVPLMVKTSCLSLLHFFHFPILHLSTQVRSGMEVYAGAARRRVHLATVLLRPPSGHRPGGRQARHAHIL